MSMRLNLQWQHANFTPIQSTHTHTHALVEECVSGAVGPGVPELTIVQQVKDWTVMAGAQVGHGLRRGPRLIVEGGRIGHWKSESHTHTYTHTYTNQISIPFSHS